MASGKTDLVRACSLSRLLVQVLQWPQTSGPAVSPETTQSEALLPNHGSTCGSLWGSWCLRTKPDTGDIGTASNFIIQGTGPMLDGEQAPMLPSAAMALTGVRG